MNTAAVPAVPTATPRLSPGREHLVRAAAALWRVVDARGRVRGHLRAVETSQGVRYRAERYRPATAGFVEVGAFWSPDDAVAALR